MQNPFKFTSNWSSHEFESQWLTQFKELIGRPRLRYLEIGVFEGRSFFWTLENILTDPTCEAFAVDPFNGIYAENFEKNREASGRSAHIQTIVSRSQEALVKLTPESFDLIFIDGDHSMSAVIQDFVLSWRLLKDNGFLVFDDYLWRMKESPVNLRPELAVDTILMAFQGELEILYKGYQVIVRKRKGPLADYNWASNCRSFTYSWYTKRVRKNDEDIELSREEIATIEKMLMTIHWPDPDFQTDDPVFSGEEALALMRKLNISVNDFKRNPNLIQVNKISFTD